MSQNYYLDQLVTALNKLRAIVRMDTDRQKDVLLSDGEQFNNISELTNLYLRYISIVNQLYDIDDQLTDFRIQKKIRIIFEVTIARALQIWSEICHLKGSFSHSFCNELIEMNITPFDIQLRTPIYFTREKMETIESRNLMIQTVRDKIIREDSVLSELGHELEEENDNSNEVTFENRGLPMPKSIENGLVRKQESLDQQSSASINNKTSGSDNGKFNDKLLSQVNADKFINSLGQDTYDEIKTDDQVRRTTTSISSRPKAKIIDEEQKERNRRTRDRNKVNFLADLNVEKELWRNHYKEKFEENIEQELREWYIEFYQQCGLIPPFPTKDKFLVRGQTLGIPSKVPKEFKEKTFHDESDWPTDINDTILAGALEVEGSAVITSCNWIGAGSYLTCKNEIIKLTKEKKEAKEKKETKKEKKKKAVKSAVNDVSPVPTCLVILEKILYEPKRDYNEAQQDFTKEEAIFELNHEVREDIDAIIRQELVNIESGLSRTGKKRKNAKPQKKMKQKRIPDGDQPDLLEKLVRATILNERQWITTDPVFELPHSTLDQNNILEILKAISVLPLGSQTIHRLAPLTRSVCLYGPKGTGKNTFIRLVALESSSAIFDISPETIAKLNLNKKDLKELMAGVFSMSRQFQPSLIFINNVEKVFYKKVPPEERIWSPKQIQPFLKSFLSAITPNEQIQIMGISNQPWLADFKKLQSVFEKIIHVPPPFYGITRGSEITAAFKPALYANASNRYGLSMERINDDNKNITEEIMEPQVFETLFDGKTDWIDSEKYFEFASKISFSREKQPRKPKLGKQKKKK